MNTTTDAVSSTDQKINKAVSNTIENFKQNPDDANATFTVRSKLDDGFLCKSNIRDLEVISDEPEELGGTNQGPNPVEHALNALAVCQEMLIKVHAGQLGINLKSVEVKVNGDIDLKGFFNVGDAKAGFKSITYETIIKPEKADENKLQQLKQISIDNCPVLDIFQNPVEVKGNVTFID